MQPLLQCFVLLVFFIQSRSVVYQCFCFSDEKNEPEDGLSSWWGSFYDSAKQKVSFSAGQVVTLRARGLVFHARAASLFYLRQKNFSVLLLLPWPAVIEMHCPSYPDVPEACLNTKFMCSCKGVLNGRMKLA